MKSKRYMIQKFLEKHGEILIRVNLKHPDLVAPDSFKKGDNPFLRIGYNTKVSGNLRLTEEGISANMPFTAGIVSYCEIPWEAIIRVGAEGRKKVEKKPSLRIVK